MPEPDLSQQSTGELLRRIPAGDLNARATVFERYRARVLLIARARLSARLRTHVESSDILQEALLEALRSLDHFELRDESSLIRWLAVLVDRRISANTRYIDAQKRSAAGLVSNAGEQAERALTSNEPSPSRAVVQQESDGIVCAALAELPEKQRELVLLRDYAGSSWDTIATELGLSSPDAARMLHARALVLLGALLRARGLGDRR